VIGSRLSHYRILEKLGEGGMGIVFLAEDERLHRKVALKTLPPALAEDPQRLARFEREVKTVAALNHPNIVTIYSVEEADGKRFFTMEHVEGKTLSQIVPPGGMPLGEFLRIAVPLADALAAAHAKGIQHRDLKPGNVMVNSDGRVKVLDFGLAKLREHETTDAMGFHPQTTLTQEGLAIGTLAYMAPEQLRMLPTDPRADLFSLGVVLYEMATGSCPFRGQSTAEVISAILRDTPPRTYEQNELIPPEIDTVLRRCLEKEPARRFASAVEVRDALAEVAHSVDLGRTRSRISKPESSAVQIVKSRYARFAVAALAIVLLGAGLFAWRARAPQAAVAATASPIAAPLPSLVVLPLSNFSDEPEYFVDGMTDALISALARIEGVRVISRQSAMHYKDSTKLLPQIARELGVDFVVEGSIARIGETVRLNAQVIQADPETTLWSESFERAAGEILELQNNFAGAIARAVHARISPVEEVQLAATRAVDPDAYEAYLQGRFFANQFGEANSQKAMVYFQKAIGIDPAFALAWAGLSDALQDRSYYYVIEPQKGFAEAEAAARKAISLDPGLSDAHSSLGDLLLFTKWSWAEGEAELDEAVRLNPNSANARRRRWLLYSCLRRFAEGRAEIEFAQHLDPLSPLIHGDVAVQRLLDGDPQQALVEIAATLELDPAYSPAHYFAWLAYEQLDKDPERGLELERLLPGYRLETLQPEFIRRRDSDGYAAALLWFTGALAEKANQERVPTSLVATFFAQAGEEDLAMSWLERCHRERCWDLAWLSAAPDYTPLHGRADFRRLVERLGLPQPPQVR
jgi:serine/threonine protein kinase/tetratricopeptide (TPR) repeat protein